MIILTRLVTGRFLFYAKLTNLYYDIVSHVHAALGVQQWLDCFDPAAEIRLTSHSTTDLNLMQVQKASCLEISHI
jgi:hypothetical protein